MLPDLSTMNSYAKGLFDLDKCLFYCTFIGALAYGMPQEAIDEATLIAIEVMEGDHAAARRLELEEAAACQP